MLRRALWALVVGLFLIALAVAVMPLGGDAGCGSLLFRSDAAKAMYDVQDFTGSDSAYGPGLLVVATAGLGVVIAFWLYVTRPAAYAK